MGFDFAPCRPRDLSMELKQKNKRRTDYTTAPAIIASILGNLSISSTWFQTHSLREK